MKFVSILIFIMIGFRPVIDAQLCTGSLGDPVVDITFGAGSGSGDALVQGQTSYLHSRSSCPNRGV
jgi:hypothetical protein